MKLYNTQTRRKEEFVPRQEGKVFFYVCGPTVYNHIHVGNARTFISFDTIRRYLMHKGYDVTFVQNVTDVDDKIINRANEEGRTAAEVAAEYTQAFIEAMHKVNVLDPTVRPKATEEIPAMIELIQGLIDGGHAYEVEGDVYFSVRSFPEYGKLSGRDIDDLQSGARIDIDERKHDPLDFALWKAAKPGEPFWESPWGQGRPGWHIECSAMSKKYCGLPLDIHGGGSDLVFPHHENEVAQSEACYGCTFSNYWMHGGMLLIDSEKMSKSLGNFMLLKDVLEQVDWRVLRLLMMQTHYRNPLDYNPERLAEATTSFERISSCVRNARWAAENAADGVDDAMELEGFNASIEDCRRHFDENMDDDFNTAGALGAIFSLVGVTNVFIDRGLGADGKALAAQAADCIEELLGVFGILLEDGAGDEGYPVECVALAAELAGYTGDDPAEAIQVLLDARAAARAEKNWAVADGVRDGLSGLGFVIEDTASGARVTYKA